MNFGSDDYHCIRCNRPYKWEQLVQTPEGILMCPKCWDAFKNEPVRKCPVDGHDMRKQIVAEIHKVDKCATCGGVWFDREDLMAIKEQWLDEGRREMFFPAFLMFLT